MMPFVKLAIKPMKEGMNMVRKICRVDGFVAGADTVGDSGSVGFLVWMLSRVRDESTDGLAFRMESSGMLALEMVCSSTASVTVAMVVLIVG